MRNGIDAAFPASVIAFGVPKVNALGGYIGGNTPHPWTDGEWEMLTNLSGAQFWLPIFVRSTGGDPAQDAAQVIAWLTAHGAPTGITVALDFETRIDATYLRTFDTAIMRTGRKVMVYGSKGTLFFNPMPSGGYWVADYTGIPHLYPGSAATQWSGSAKFGGAYDPDIFADATPLWEANDVTPQQLQDGLKQFFRTTGPVNVPQGQLNNDGIFANLMGGVQKLHNDIGAVPTADEVANAVVAKLPPGNVSLTVDDVKNAVKAALREGTGSVV